MSGRAVWAAAMGEAGRAVAGGLRRLVRPPRLRRVPDRLVVAPHDLRGSDPTVAAALAAGAFRVESPRPAASPFAPDPAPTLEAALALHGYGWLRHLRAHDVAEAREGARALLAEPLGPGRGEWETGPGRATAVAARRLISLLSHSPVVLAGADHGFYVAYLGAIGRDAAALGRDMTDSPRPLDRLRAAIAVCYAGLCCTGLERPLRRAARALAAELDAQILPEGGHAGRNPAVLVDLLLDLLPLKFLFARRGLATPPALERALENGAPFLRHLRHGDGDLALFHGMGRTSASDVATLLSHATDPAGPAPGASRSGYDRLEAGGTVAIVDTGELPPPPLAADAHAGPLAFELSSGPDRLVVNGGAPPEGSPHRALARATAAHSTLTVADRSAARVLGPDRPGGLAARFLLRRLGPLMLPGPTAVRSARRTARDGALRVSGQHDGYARAFGAVHARRLELSPDGRALKGGDTLTLERKRAEALPATLRFHLHPDVAAEADEDGVTLRAPSGRRWRFTQEGGRATLEDGAFFAVPERWRPTTLIAVELAVGPGEAVATCRWAFRRLPDEPSELGSDEPLESLDAPAPPVEDDPP